MIGSATNHATPSSRLWCVVQPTAAGCRLRLSGARTAAVTQRPQVGRAQWHQGWARPYLLPGGSPLDCTSEGWGAAAGFCDRVIRNFGEGSTSHDQDKQCV